ncbi:MAG: anti-sigma factor family protein [Solirubrobacteraceae bacterium]
MDFVELATEYLEGALSVEQRLVMERHLAFCSPCMDYLEQMRATIAATGGLRAQDVPEPVIEPLMAAFRALRTGRD